MRPIGDSHTAFSVQDLLQLIEEGKRLDKTSILETHLKMQGYIKREENLYYLKDPEQLIELTKTEEGTSYINKLNPNDKGMFIQFLQNRLPEGKQIYPNDEFSLLPSALLYGLYIEEQQLEKSKVQNKKPIQKKRKGKGL